MKVLLINSVSGIRSTGRICSDLATILMENGHECRIAYGRESAPEQFESVSYKMASDIQVKLDGLKTRLFDNAGFNSKSATKRFIEWIKDYAPDVIHLHNLHGYYINIELLFEFLKEYKKPVIWTLHDCWSFTGHCSHFTIAGCNKWKTGCFDCVQKNQYPSSLFLDNSKNNFRKKKELFTGIDNMVIVTPSEWLASVTRKSYLGKYEVVAIPNGVDLEKYKYTESDFRKTHSLEGKKIILGAATAWSESKGLSEFSRLAELAGDDYKVVLVGIQPGQEKELSDKLLALPRTNSIEEMAQIYSAADVFVNASREETMGLTTVEAMACGTPAVASNYTAVPEVIRENGGIVIENVTAEGIFEGVKIVLSKEYPSTRENAKLYEKYQQYEKYLDIYNKIKSE